ncbi:hypothetical protein C8R44DRAFT_737066 [Mycena epipterygia]|nr:hypothetical protein C8R44DRAFT_737066 [Mycena epipterygia]
MISPTTPESATAYTETWGLQMVAYAIDLVLYGVALVIAINHLRPDDTIATKTTNFTAFVTDYSNPAQLDRQVFSGPYMTALTAQMFLPKESGFVSFGSTVLFSLGQLVYILSFWYRMRVGTFSNLDSTARYNCTQGAMSAACDIVITASFCWLLHSSRTTSHRTNTVIDKLIMYAINRGAATSMIFFFASTQFYVISVTSMLITRDSLREELQKVPDTNLALSTLQVRQPASEDSGNGAISSIHSLLYFEITSLKQYSSCFG